VQYGLDKAERDKALLLAQKRQNSLYFALTILLLAVIAVVYLWRNLLRIKHLQHNLSVESQRAQESERLKRDFMGSMSHEIRLCRADCRGGPHGGRAPGVRTDHPRQYAALHFAHQRYARSVAAG
jgi:hypothetical protein